MRRQNRVPESKKKQPPTDHCHEALATLTNQEIRFIIDFKQAHLKPLLSRKFLRATDKRLKNNIVAALQATSVKSMLAHLTRAQNQLSKTQYLLFKREIKTYREELTEHLQSQEKAFNDLWTKNNEMPIQNGDSVLLAFCQRYLNYIASYMPPEILAAVKYHTVNKQQNKIAAYFFLISDYLGSDGILFFHLFPFLTVQEQILLSTVTRKTHDLHQELLEYDLQQVKQTFADQKTFTNEVNKIVASHPPYLIKMLGGMGNILKIPNFSLGNLQGNTDHLDFYIVGQFSKHFRGNIVRGFDCFDRAFYIIKANKPHNSQSLADYSIRGVIGHQVRHRALVQTRVLFSIFQRFTDARHWECGSMEMANWPASSSILDRLGDSRTAPDSYFCQNPEPRLGRVGARWFAKLYTNGHAGTVHRHKITPLHSFYSENTEAKQQITLHVPATEYAYAAWLAYQQANQTKNVPSPLLEMIVNFCAGPVETRMLLERETYRTVGRYDKTKAIPPQVSLSSHAFHVHRRRQCRKEKKAETSAPLTAPADDATRPSTSLDS